MKHPAKFMGLVLLALMLSPYVVSVAFAQRGPEASTRPEDVVRQQKFSRFWEERFTRDISADLLPFVDDPDPELAGRAVRALGRLEKSGVLAKLQKRRDVQNDLLKKSNAGSSVQLNRVLPFDTAVARIQSRNLHGKAKIEFVLQGMPTHWKWQEAVKWSQKVSNLKNYLTISPEAAQVREVVDLLYTMSKNGENIEPLRKQFTFTKAQDVQLDGAKLPLAQEAEHLLDYAQSLDIVGADDEYVCESHLLSLGGQARTALRQRMQLLLQTKPKFNNRFPFDCMLRAAAMSGDQTFLPLIKSYDEQMRYVRYTSSLAQQAAERLEEKTIFSFAPQ